MGPFYRVVSAENGRRAKDVLSCYVLQSNPFKGVGGRGDEKVVKRQLDLDAVYVMYTRWATGARLAIEEIDEKKSARSEDVGGSASYYLPVQAIAYRNFMAQAFPPSLEVTVLRRLVKFQIVDPTQDCIPEFQHALF